MTIPPQSLPDALLWFGFGALAIALLGAKLTRLADRLADETGLGEAVFGAVLLGATTSLPGSVASLTAALAGHPELAVSNAVGGIAAQTVFLVVADLVYRRANLEHAAASVPNLSNGALLCALLALPLMAALAPEMALWGVHPASGVMLAMYLVGLRLATQARDAPAWQPVRTGETREDVPARKGADRGGVGRLWLGFALTAAVVAIAGWMVGEAGIALVRLTGLSETLVGSLFTAVATSLPELVTTVAAVRQGALTLAVSGIIGGNTFDVLFLVLADGAYREGSIYHAIGPAPLFLISLAILLTAILLLGLIQRQRHGWGNIGFESVAVLGFYLAGLAILTW
ncbi:sodium:calcium antiporter [Thiorhodovibrio winogradskyi]|nr:sodium:calcium antiporter [Thiorhodovibrio winogradskyi]